MNVSVTPQVASLPLSSLPIQVKSKVPLLLFCPQSQEGEGMPETGGGGLGSLGSWVPTATDPLQNISGLGHVSHAPSPKLLPVCPMIPTTSWRELLLLPVLT